MGEKIEGPWTTKKSKIETKEDKWVLDTSIEAIGKSDEAFMKKLKENDWDGEEMQEAWYGFHEALANAIGHGNLKIKKQMGDTATTGTLIEEELAKNIQENKRKKVEVIIEMDKEKIIVKIRDEGAGFNIKDVKDPTSEEGQLKTSGRGVFLMRRCFDVVDSYPVVDDDNKEWNEVILIKKKKK